LELTILASLGYWGWTVHEGLGSALWGIGLPLTAAVLWGTFRVPGDPGDAPVPVPGPVRLLLEAVLFSAAVGLLAAAGREALAVALGAAVVVHYGVSYDRVLWLMRR
jgi:hypothetical protein